MSAPQAASWLRSFKELDIFRKLPVENREEAVGASEAGVGLVLRVLSLVLIAYLCICESISYFQVEEKQEFIIDQNPAYAVTSFLPSTFSGAAQKAFSGRKMRVNLDVTIHDFPCIDLSLDYQDVMGNRGTDVKDTIFKQRLQADGSPVGEASKNDPQAVNRGVSNPSIVRNKSGNESCGDCYGALPEGECCNTCSDVLYAYRLKRWALPRIESISQCKHDGSGKSAYQPPQIVHLSDYSSDDYLRTFKTIGDATSSSGNEARFTAPLKLNLSLFNITFKPLSLKKLDRDLDDDWDDDYDEDYFDYFDYSRRKKDKNKPLSWPDCVRRNVVVNGFDVGEALMEDLSVHGAKEGCWKDDCTKTDKFNCDSMDHCAAVCSEMQKCQWWTWGVEEFAAKCWLRTGRHGKTKRYGFSTGSRNCTAALKTATTSPAPSPESTKAEGKEAEQKAEEPESATPRRLMSLDDDDLYGSDYRLPWGSSMHMPMFGWRSLEDEKRKEQKGESCRFHGYFDVNKVPGNFHIGTHGSNVPSYLSFYDEPSPPQQNMQHTINSLFFTEASEDGITSGKTQPLDGFESPKAFTFQYYLTITPARWQRDDMGKDWNYWKERGYQYRSSSFVTNELIGPAVFFRMEIDPILVRYYREGKRFTSFLISLSAIVGGCIALFTMLAQAAEAASAIAQDKD